MRRLPLALSVLVVLLAAAPGPAGAAPDPCARTRSLEPAQAPAGLLRTPAPFEHFGPGRSQVFPYSCTLRELTGVARPTIATHAGAPQPLTPYSIVTGNRRELFTYGYSANAATQGATVERVDPVSLRVRWRTRVLDPHPAGQWSYPGVLLAHRNGSLYAIYGNIIVRIDRENGHVLARRALPENPRGTGSAYNGMVVLPDGRIVAKRIERGPCPAAAPALPTLTGAFIGLTCAGRNQLGTKLVVVDPAGLRVIARTAPPEPVTGRLSFGGGYVYCAGRTHLFRYRYAKGRLTLDRRWGFVTYRTGGQTPGTGPGLLGRFVVVQTNFLPSSAPLTVTAVDTRNPRRVFRIRPFAGLSASSWIVSKPALDAATSTVISHDTSAGHMAALHLDPRRGFTIRWRRTLHSLAFSALVGPAAHRQIVIPDLGGTGDRVRWLDERTGREEDASPPLDPSSAPGNIVTPGFGGRFYYGSASGRLWALRPER